MSQSAASSSLGAVAMRTVETETPAPAFDGWAFGLGVVLGVAGTLLVCVAITWFWPLG